MKTRSLAVTFTLLVAAPVPSSAAPPADEAGLAPPDVPAPTPAPAPTAPQTVELRAPAPARASILVAAEIGVQKLSIAALKGSDTSVLAIDGSPTATLLGAAGSIWLRPLTLGVRVRFAHTSLINYWNVGPEIGVRLPLAGVEPYGFLGVGYASVAGLGQVLTTTPQGFPTSGGNLAARGYDARLGLGVDFPFKPFFTVGGVVAAEIVHLSYSVDGASVGATTTGLATSASLVVGAQL